MALAFTKVYSTKDKNLLVGNGVLHETIYDVTLDTDYPTGGWPVTAANLGLTTIKHAQADTPNGYVLKFDHVNSKLMAFVGDNDAVADGPLAECAAGLNGLDTLVARVRTIGT